MHLRPIITLHNAVGALLLGYAAAVLATPTSGAIAWIDSRTFLTPETVAGAFAVCGLAVCSLLTTPLLLYAIAALGFFFSRTDVGMTGVIGHLGVWVVINAVNYERARQWTN